MTHRGKVKRDSNGRWLAVCDCTLQWSNARWRDAFDSVFSHVSGYRKTGTIGFGFTKSKNGPS